MKTSVVAKRLAIWAIVVLICAHSRLFHSKEQRVAPSAIGNLDPTAFLKVLGVDTGSKEQNLRLIKKRFGETKQLNHGDAAGYEGRIEYVLRDHSTMITFNETECTTGFVVERAYEESSLGKTIIGREAKKIEVAGLRLGMNRIDVEKIFGVPLSGGWELDKKNSKVGAFHYVFRKTVAVKPGDSYCDRIWIDLEFDEQRKLEQYSIRNGGCDDAACEDNASQLSWSADHSSPEAIVLSAATALTGEQFNQCFYLPKGSGKEGYGAANWSSLRIVSVKPSKWAGKEKGDARILSGKAVDVLTKPEWKGDWYGSLRDKQHQELFVVDEIDGRWLIDSMWLLDSEGKHVRP